jgi:subtilisin-like proprotein convertase family protein
LAKHHSGQDPSTTGLGVPLRGFWSFSTYSGGATDQAFSSDFVVHYAYSDLASGGYSGWSSSASTTQHPLNLAYQKILIGYPSTDSFYLNRTGPFTASFKKTVGRHFWNDDVAVVSGMSGGGAFIYNSVEAEYQLAGVIVSGNANDGQPGTGVRALDTNAVRLLTAAATSADRSTPVSRTVTLSPALAIPDATRRWTVVKLPITDLPSKVEEVVVSCTITHPWISDLQVVLRAPSRKTRTLHNRQGYGYEDLTFDKVSASTSFRGTKTNGEWELLVRDLVGDDTGTINSVELTVTGR